MRLGTATQQQLPCISDFDPGADDGSLLEHIDTETDNACELIGRACRAFIDGNPMSARACADLLREAAEMLVSLADEVTQ